jgi:hypothetical protein
MQRSESRKQGRKQSRRQRSCSEAGVASSTKQTGVSNQRRKKGGEGGGHGIGAGITEQERRAGSRRSEQG